MSARRRALAPRAGFTLVELIVVVAILGVTAGVAGVAFRTRDRSDHVVTPAAARVAEARREAFAAGQAVTVEIAVGAQGVARATAFPDGRVVADPALGVDELTGRTSDDARR